MLLADIGNTRIHIYDGKKVIHLSLRRQRQMCIRDRCSPRLHRFNEYPFGFVGVVRGLHPTGFYKNQKHYNCLLYTSPSPRD